MTLQSLGSKIIQEPWHKSSKDYLFYLYSNVLSTWCEWEKNGGGVTVPVILGFPVFYHKALRLTLLSWISFFRYPVSVTVSPTGETPACFLPDTMEMKNSEHPKRSAKAFRVHWAGFSALNFRISAISDSPNFLLAAWAFLWSNGAAFELSGVDRARRVMKMLPSGRTFSMVGTRAFDVKLVVFDFVAYCRIWVAECLDNCVNRSIFLFVDVGKISNPLSPNEKKYRRWRCTWLVNFPSTSQSV